MLRSKIALGRCGIINSTKWNERRPFLGPGRDEIVRRSRWRSSQWLSDKLNNEVNCLWSFAPFASETLTHCFREGAGPAAHKGTESREVDRRWKGANARLSDWNALVLIIWSLTISFSHAEKWLVIRVLSLLNQFSTSHRECTHRIPM